MSFEELDYEGCFKAAFGLRIGEIEGANGVPVGSLFDAISANSGNPRKQAKALMDCLGASRWRWTAYEGRLEKEKG
jgi:hypothetical protein